MQAHESSRRESRDALRATESAISEVNRALRELDARGRDAQSRLQSIGERRRGLEAELARQQAALGRVLAATYAGGAPGALRLALSGDDPNESARQLHYIALVSGAAARLVGSYRAGLGKLESVKRSALDQSAQLEAIERERRGERERVLAERRERQRVLERIAGELRRTRREVRVLQADESRLARVVEEIAKVLTARPGAGHAPRAVDRVPDAASAAGPFSRLRGRLRLPVRGELIGRFGAQLQGVGRGTQGNIHPFSRGRGGACGGGGQGGVCRLDEGRRQPDDRRPRRGVPVDLRQQRVAAQAARGRRGGQRPGRHRGRDWRQRANRLIF